MPGKNEVTAVTNEQGMQFINPGNYPRFVQYKFPVKRNVADDCTKELKKRTICVILNVDFTTDRSAIWVFNIDAKEYGFKKPVDRNELIVNAERAMGISSLEESLSNGDEQLKRFFSKSYEGEYNELNLGVVCDNISKKLLKSFTRWDAVALKWALLLPRYSNIKQNAQLSLCIGGEDQKKELESMGLAYPK